MADCTRCGTGNRSGARFCGVCGNPLAATAAGKSPPAGKVRTKRPGVDPAPVPSAPQTTATSRPSWLTPLILAGLAIVFGGGIGLVLAQGGNGDSRASADSDASGDPGTSPDDDEGDDAGTTGADADDASDRPDDRSSDAPPQPPAVRSGTLFSNFARLRTGPAITNPEVTTLTREGAPLEIIGRHRDGWYEIRMDGSQGWVFGTFVTPPPAGHRIIQSSSGSIVLRDAGGSPLGITNESGPKALATGSAGNLWQVILPDGTTAYVLRTDVFVAAG